MTTQSGDAAFSEETGGGTDLAPPATDAATAPAGAIEGRSLGQIAWGRLRKDRVAMASGVVLVLLILIAIFAPLLNDWLGYPLNDKNPGLIDPNLQIPTGGMGGISSKHLLGVDVPLGRDILSRVLYGSQISLLIATLSTLLSLIIGVLLGVAAGYFGGWVDTVIGRLMDVFLTFPLLLFAIALSGVVQDKAFGMQGLTLHIVVLVFIIGFFNWPYIGRIVRGQTISLHEREFVDAARSLGASHGRIIFKELMPNLLAPIIVYATLLIPTNILFEAALSFLGVGVKEPTPSWGQMLNEAIGSYQADPEFLIVPGLAIFITVLAFNLLGDGLRDAFDPKGT
jgi:peptide/nickel transport system permease protein